MTSLTQYFSKYLISFLALIFLLVILNGLAFVGTFYNAITKDYGETSPRVMLEEIASNQPVQGILDTAKAKLQSHHIWAMFLSPSGQCLWTVDLPPELPTQYTIQDAAVFAKGYLQDYPVFVWNDADGLLVLGYPKGSYVKITSNYYAADIFKTIPLYFAGVFVFDLLALFGAYYLSKVKVINDTAPLVSAIKTLADGKSVSLAVSGELAEIADSVSKASQILSRQNNARANWISGISHDIRTPLSMILGYAGRIIANDAANAAVKEQAKIIQQQSIIIKELVQDLNLVSQLEYEMQPLQKAPVFLAKLLRSYAADLLNGEILENYSIAIDITPAAETVTLDGDARLIIRAISNLVQNSIKHNPQGCHIYLSLDCDTMIALCVADDGVGLSAEKRKALEEKPHYLESTDERLDLRHGLGLVLVRQITAVHGGTMKIESEAGCGYQTILRFPC